MDSSNTSIIGLQQLRQPQLLVSAALFDGRGRLHFLSIDGLEGNSNRQQQPQLFHRSLPSEIGGEWRVMNGHCAARCCLLTRFLHAVFGGGTSSPSSGSSAG